MNVSLPIQTRSLVLRHFVLEDAPKVFVMSQELGIRTWIPDQTYEHEQAAFDVLGHLIAQYDDPATPSRAAYVLGVCLRSSSELVGHVGLSPARNQVEVGCAIESGHQGKGFASEAVAAMSEWGIRRFDLPLVLGIVASDNIASRKVLERSGFTLNDESMRSLHGIRRLVRTYQKTPSPAPRCAQQLG